MGLTRRNAAALAALLAAAVILLGVRAWRLRGVPLPLTRATPSGTEVLLDVNRASIEELEALPWVGPVLAAEIVRHRPYRDVSELARVPGLGPRGLERLAALLRVEAAP